MGACTSGANDGPEGDEYKSIPAPELVRIAAMQRRKLSVAGTHVGDLNNPSSSRMEARPLFVDVSLGEGHALLTQACLSRKGVIPYSKQKTNQDRFVSQFEVQGDPQISFFAVMDGHGLYGHLVSQFIADNFIRCLEMGDIRPDPEAAIQKAVRLCCQELKKTAIDLSFSGSTLVCGLVVGTEDENKKLTRHIYCGNIGDSRAVLIREQDGKHVAEALSVDQKPDNPGERERIEAAGGRIATIQGPPGEELGPMRVWLKDLEVPGLAMSRSIGDDISQQVGVISVPEVFRHEVHPTDEYAVWATDGVWEFLSNQEVADIIMGAGGDLTKACQLVVDEATHRWREREEVIDDITCVVVDLWSIPKKQPGKSRPPGPV